MRKLKTSNKVNMLTLMRKSETNMIKMKKKLHSANKICRNKLNKQSRLHLLMKKISMVMALSHLMKRQHRNQQMIKRNQSQRNTRRRKKIDVNRKRITCTSRPLGRFYQMIQ